MKALPAHPARPHHLYVYRWPVLQLTNTVGESHAFGTSLYARFCRTASGLGPDLSPVLQRSCKHWPSLAAPFFRGRLSFTNTTELQFVKRTIVKVMETIVLVSSVCVELRKSEINNRERLGRACISHFADFIGSAEGRRAKAWAEP